MSHDDLNALIELADHTRGLVAAGNTAEISDLIRTTLENSRTEAFSWIIGILAEGVPEDFVCTIGRAIPDYDAFVDILGVKSEILSYEVTDEHDEIGEIRAVSTTYIRKTKYENIFLVTSENVDNLDRDYIEYRLLFK